MSVRIAENHSTNRAFGGQMLYVDMERCSIQVCLLRMRTSNARRIARCTALVSRILFPLFPKKGREAAIHLGCTLLRTSSGTSVKSNWFSTGTALHRGKDFAVSLLRCRKIIPEGILLLSESASLFAPLISRCAGVTRYPATRSFKERAGLCPDFPPPLSRERLPCAGKNYTTS